MKRLITLSVAMLSVCAVVVVSPSSGSAAPGDKSTKTDGKTVIKSTVNASQERTYFVRSRECATGSFIPSVYRVYRGVATSTASSSGRAYTDLGPAGSDNVGTSLARLDPSISLSGFGRR